MKVVSGMTRVVDLPLDEADKIIDAMEQAEKAGDLEGLKWCARMFRWLRDQGEAGSTDTYCYAENLFNRAWDYAMEKDPPPASIAAVVTREEEGPDGEAAAHALDTLKAFFEENIAKKELPSALKTLEGLRDAVADIAGEME